MRWVVLAMAVAGCAQTASTVTYGYQVHAAALAAHTDGPDAPAAETTQMLVNARTVAFFPPDPCDARCTELVTTLERGAEHAGYQVVAWQNLRGAKRPIDFAREANVDVLFQIDRIETGTQSEAPNTRSLTFSEDAAPLQVSSVLAQTCQEYSLHADPPHAVASTTTLDVQALSVSDGVTRWRYHRAVVQPVTSTYAPISFTGTVGVNHGGRALMGLGIAALVTGVGLIVLEQTSQKDPLNPSQGEFSTGGLSWLAAAAGVAGIAGGGYLLSQGGPKPPPEEVLCDGQHMVPISGAPAPPAAAATSDEAIIGPLLDELDHAKGAK